MLTPRHQIRIAQPIIYLGLVHAAAVLDRPVLAIEALAVLCAFSVIANLATRGSRGELIGWTVATAVMIAVVAAAYQGWRQATSIILFPPVLINLYFLYIFGRTLRPGRVALITHFSTLNVGEPVPEPLRTYTRTLTILWTFLFALMALESAVLAAYFDLEAWSWVVNVLNPAIAVAFFVFEHVYRVYRYSMFGPFSLMRAIRIMLRPDAWVQADAKPSQ